VTDRANVALGAREHEQLSRTGQALHQREQDLRSGVTDLCDAGQIDHRHVDVGAVLDDAA
jgi:hypothetical protein